MHTLKILLSDNDLENFKNSYAASFSERSKIAKREFQLDELRSQVFVYGLFNKDKMIAGFILNFNPNRCLSTVNENTRNEVIEKLGKNNVCELIGIWKNRNEKSILTTISMWTHILTKTLGLGKPFIFGCNRSPKVGSEYYYQSEYQVVPNCDSELVVFYYTRKQFLMTFLSSLFNFLNKKRVNPNIKEAV